MKEYFDKLYIKTAKEFHAEMKDNLVNNKKAFVVTANPETLMIAESNEEFKKALLDKDTTIVPDGIGVVKGARMLGIKVKERIPGVEFSEKLLEYANELGKSVYLFGSKKEVIEKMEQIIKEKYSNIKIVGMQDGYIDDKDKVFDDIVEKEPDIILVALGIPKQELIIYKNLNRFKKGIFVGVGGTFDVLSGLKKRAPKFFLKFHLEWLYRICKEPNRFKRFYESNIKYISIIRKEKRGMKND